MAPNPGSLIAAALAVFLPFWATATRADTYAVTNTNVSGTGSLAQAILDANGRPGQDTITFNIPGSGVHVIDLSQGSLPEITDSVIVDGYTQPGAHPNSLSVGNDAVILIQLDGGSIKRNGRGLVLSGSNCLVRGLAITGFQFDPTSDPFFFRVLGGFGIHLLSPGTGNVIQGNFIGLNPDGFTPMANYFGIKVEAPQSIIGGTESAARNVISGNNAGVVISTSSSGPATVLGNYIGTDASGARAVGNHTGVQVAGADNVIGGTAPGAGNVISGNQWEGIELGYRAAYHITAVSERTVIQGNLIGTTADGTGALGNGATAVFLTRSIGAIIGGLASAAGNVVAFNGGGIYVPGGGTFGQGNSVLSNSIYANYSHAIVLVGSANNGQSAPVITASRISNGIATINGTLASAANTTFLIQFFADSQSLTSSEQTYLGSKNVTTNGNGQASFSASFPIPDNNVVFSATATDPAGNTSEFSRNAPVLQNISTRAAVGTGENALIGGFIARSGPVVVRGLGPSLESHGVGNALADPVLELYDRAGSRIEFNDNWQDDQYKAGVIQQFGLAPDHPAEAALIFFPSVPTTAHTAVLRGKNDTTGVGVVEAYGLDARLANLSSRGRAGTDDDVMIGGFILADGNQNTRIVVRGIGPSLKTSGIADPLTDPELELRDGNGELIGRNDDWSETQSDDLQTVGLAPAETAESAILVRLPAGAYTAIVRGKNNSTGVAVVEVYDLR